MRICQIYNFASHYRFAIYNLINKEFNADFVFGSCVEDLKKMDISQLNGNAIEVPYKKYYGFTYQRDILHLLRKPYDTYILTGETRCISTWLFLILSKFYTKKKIYLWSHGWYGKETYFERIVKKVFFKLPNGGIFLYGNYAKQLMIKEGFNKDKLFVIHNSLDYEEHLVLRGTMNPTSIYINHFHNTSPVLIMIGRLNLRKKLNLLIEALAVLRDNGKIYNLVLVGSGDDKSKLEKLSVDLNLNNQIWFYGACYDEKKNAELIYNADMCVVPGDIGLTAIHALTFGTPVITHNRYCTQGPEFEAITEGKTGTFFEYGSIDSLAESINDWFEKYNGKREEIRTHCFNEIDTAWNPGFQLNVLRRELESKI